MSEINYENEGNTYQQEEYQILDLKVAALKRYSKKH